MIKANWSGLRGDTQALFGSNLFSALILFLTAALITQQLGVAAYGLYAAALAWVYPLSLLAEFGLSTLLVRELSRNPDAATAYVRAALRLRLRLGLPLVLGLWLLAALLAPAQAPLATALALSAPLILINALTSTYSAAFRAFNAVRLVANLNMGMLAAQIVLMALAVALGADVLGLLAINTLTSLGQASAARWLYRRRFATGKKHPLDANALLRQAMPFATAGVLAALGLRLGTLLAFSIGGAEVAGLFAVAWRFIEVGRLLPMAYFDALYPRLNRLDDQPNRLDREFRNALGILVGYGGLFTLVMVVTGGFWMTLLFGEALSHPPRNLGNLPIADPAAVQALAYASLGLWAHNLKGLYILRCYSEQREGWVNGILALGVLLTLASGLAFISAWGAAGAGMAYALSEVLALGVLWGFRRRYPTPMVNQ